VRISDFASLLPISLTPCFSWVIAGSNATLNRFNGFHDGYLRPETSEMRTQMSKRTFAHNRIESPILFVQLSWMGKRITIRDDAYRLLSSLKRRPGDSFRKVILRHLNRPADTGAEILEAMDRLPPPEVDLKVLRQIERGRGRPSGSRK
jgi:predicted CopG family antitoxin